jgi:antitoxin ParD1/3/4
MPHRTPNEYSRSLIRKDQDRRVVERIEALLLEGIASGEPIEVNEAFWNKRRSALIASQRKRRR